MQGTEKGRPFGGGRGSAGRKLFEKEGGKRS